MINTTQGRERNMPFLPKGGWGPSRCASALSITFDNLGEAAELELGLWGDQPIGSHHTASFVPRLVEALGDIRTTYFMEASNVALYPEAIKQWAAAGHEVGMHAWRHEAWDRCSASRRRDLLANSLSAMRSINVQPVGFRPPGGVIPVEAWHEFSDAGLLYCSELGEPGVGHVGSVVSVPFAWSAVDVYMLEDVMGFMRVKCGDPEQPFSMSEWRERLDRTLHDAVRERSHRTIVFHPNFLATSDEKLDVVLQVIETAKSLDMWIAPVRDVAAFFRLHSPEFDRQARIN